MILLETAFAVDLSGGGKAEATAERKNPWRGGWKLGLM
jgi:hypothetical protein